MNLSDVRAFFDVEGLPFAWLRDADSVPMVATCSNPIVIDAAVAIVMPDVHLGVGAGDAFQESDPTRVPRLERFLDVVATLGATAIQLGDFYDVMRAHDPAASFEDRLAVVLAAYHGVATRSTALPLLHTIGNHDYELYAHRAELPALGINAHIVRAIGPGVIAFHGNDLVSLRDIELNIAYQTWLLSLIQTITDMPIVGPAVEALERYFDTSLADPIFDAPQFTSLAWPPAPAGSVTPAGWSAPWVVRDYAAQLGEPLLDFERSIGRPIDVAIVGHSHRPGISWCEVDFERRIPLIDVGSWTYGRTNFAVVCHDGVGIAQLVG